MPKPSNYLLHYLKHGSYPIIKFPRRVLEILGESVSVPVAPQKPVEPKKPVLTKLPKPVPPRRTALSWIGLDDDYIVKNYLYKLQVENLPTHKKIHKQAHERDLKEYKAQLKVYEENTLPEFNESLELHNHLVKLCQSDINDISSRSELLWWHLLNNAAEISPFPTNNAYTEGIAEPFFREHLLKHYGDKLVTTPSTIASVNNQRLYAPDFILHIGLLKIDIEIDEPYVASSNKPIHFLEDLNEKKRRYAKHPVPKKLCHVDDSRDAFSISNNWIVIRFSEQQAVEDPEACIHLIDEILIYLMMKPVGSNPVIEDTVRLEEQWTEYEAGDLAEKRYRELYLPPRLAQAVTNARSKYLKDNPQYEDNNDLPF